MINSHTAPRSKTVTVTEYSWLLRKNSTNRYVTAINSPKNFCCKVPCDNCRKCFPKTQTYQRATQGAWKTQGRGKHTTNPSPKKVLDPPPPPTIRSPTRLSRKRAQTRPTPLSEASKPSFGGAHSMVRFPPLQNRTISAKLCETLRKLRI